MKKIGLICLALVLALGTLGVGFALWSDSLYLEGTVETGTVNASWTACYCFDTGLDPNPDGSNKGKDVGSTVCQIDPEDPHVLHVTVTNAYPSYWNDCEVEFTNTGTIPFIIEGFSITPGAGTTLADAYGANNGQIWVAFIDGVGSQLEPGDSAGSSLKFHVEQCAEQLHTYTFTVEILVVQYNESAYY
jgi:hypothetical protein